MILISHSVPALREILDCLDYTLIIAMIEGASYLMHADGFPYISLHRNQQRQLPITHLWMVHAVKSAAHAFGCKISS